MVIVSGGHAGLFASCCRFSGGGAAYPSRCAPFPMKNRSGKVAGGTGRVQRVDDPGSGHWPDPSSREWELNPQPPLYESGALPLSYLGISMTLGHQRRKALNVSMFIARKVSTPAGHGQDGGGGVGRTTESGRGRPAVGRVDGMGRVPGGDVCRVRSVADRFAACGNGFAACGNGFARCGSGVAGGGASGTARPMTFPFSPPPAFSAPFRLLRYEAV